MYINVYYSNSSVLANKYEPQYDKSNKMMCAKQESDQPGHAPSLIRVFTAWRNIGSLATLWVYSWSESLLARAQVILLVLSWCGSYIFFNFKSYVNHSLISMFLSIATQSQLNNKIFPIWCNVNFVSVFTALYNIKNRRKFNITPYGQKFYQLTYWDKI